MGEYKYCPFCGRALTDTKTVGKSFRRCPEGHYTSYPRQTVGAAAILTDRGQILLERRAIEPGYGLWALPGGMAEPGESIEQCVARELYEETGLAIEPTKLLDVVGGKQVCIVFYEARIVAAN
ncbi:NUDIX hydrolase [Paenibacillus sp. GYB003]|uniref:NUDIX hydrolase n=1 Tax=Paenibacillus sp. GYB003 TaxID=2994392 RepID=UPI002F96380C